MSSNPHGQLPFPTELAFEPVQLCNASCFCCPYSWLKEDDEYRGKAMTRKQIKALLDDFGSVRKRHGYKGILTVNPFRFSDPLVCKELELIFELARVHDINVVITTNGAALTPKTIALLNRYRNRMLKLSISFIGSNAEEIKELMGLDFNKVLSNLDEIAENWPDLRQIVRVTLRVTRDTPQEREVLEALQKRFQGKGITVKMIHEKWMTNRIDAADFKKGVRPERMAPIPQDETRYVSGCGWANHLLERMEVMVDGSVVLCCDDAEKHKTFGNVFEQGIETIWNGALRNEHLLILMQKFKAAKCSLICSSCTRAVWSDHSATKDDMQHRSVITGGELTGNEGNQAYSLRKENSRLQKTIYDLTMRLREPTQ
jgi:MoaA/NifB/PqqE/SkfB family radical SAM enzyme